MDKRRIVIKEGYKLERPEKIERILLVLGCGDIDNDMKISPYIMIHTELSIYHICLLNMIIVNHISNLGVLNEELVEIEYEKDKVLLHTDYHIIIIE